jgi:hypothetical protein
MRAVVVMGRFLTRRNRGLGATGTDGCYPA